MVLESDSVPKASERLWIAIARPEVPDYGAGYGLGEGASSTDLERILETFAGCEAVSRTRSATGSLV